MVAEGTNGLEAIQLAETYTPDVMLLDVELLLMRGDEVVRQIRDAQPDVILLAVSSYNERLYVQGRMDNGASGYITKDEAPELLVEAVRRVSTGDAKWVSPRARRRFP